MNVQTLVPNPIIIGLLCLIGGVGYCSQKYYPETKPKLNINSIANNIDEIKGDTIDMTKNKKKWTTRSPNQKIKTLEELGIGWPSTYNPIMNTIKEVFEIIGSEELETETEKFDNIKLSDDTLQLLKDAINSDDSELNNSTSIPTAHL